MLEPSLRYGPVGSGISENELNGTKGLAEGLRLQGGVDGGSSKEWGWKVTN